MTEAVITSTKNETVKQLRRLKDKRGRMEQNAFLVEGKKSVYELMIHRPELLVSLIISGDTDEDVLRQAESMGRRIYRVDEHVMNAVCDCKTPQSIAAVARIPAEEGIRDGFIVALDDVQDPANVGTIIRTADAAGCSGVVLSYGCADCYSPKAVRASMGSLFHMPVMQADLPAYIAGLRENGCEVACAELSGETDFNLDAQHTCLVIGNEARGISEEILALSTSRIKIPIYGKAESLNAAVAAGILIYKIRS